jgi:hypothetical protein
VIVAAAFGTPAAAVPLSSSHLRPATPDSCIRSNRGDYNACNVGNRGRGDVPYRPVPSSTPIEVTAPQIRTPNDCIRANHGDWTGCNVGNSGRGDLPYRKVR